MRRYQQSASPMLGVGSGSSLMRTVSAECLASAGGREWVLTDEEVSAECLASAGGREWVLTDEDGISRVPRLCWG